MTRYNAEADLAMQLKARKIPFEREYRFCDTRRWRADFIAWRPGLCAAAVISGSAWIMAEDFPPKNSSILVEVDGGGQFGRHGTSKGMREDSEKQSAAAALGWRVVRLDERHVKNGSALAWIEAALGLRSDVAELFKLPEKKRARVKRTPKGAKLPERVRKAVGL